MFQASANSHSMVPAVVSQIAAWINRNLGIFFPEQKYPILFHKLTRVCVSRGLSIEEVWEQLNQGVDHTLLSEIASAVSTNHTAFFREDIWDYFTGTILPSLPDSGQWRIWSAAASSGHEGYTIAMLVTDYLGKEKAVGKVGILGTDISPKVLQEAERGVYTHEMVADVPERFRTASFDPAGKGLWRVKQHLRDMCLFRRLNLKVQPWPLRQKFHVIFCRNVLYYFDRATRESVIQGLYRHAADGCWLITSATETMRDVKSNWQAVRPAVYRKT